MAGGASTERRARFFRWAAMFLAAFASSLPAQIPPPSKPNEKAALLRGMVRDEEQKPIPGAKVLIYAARPKEGSSPLAPDAYPDCGKSALSDAGGRFVLEGLDPQLKFRLLGLAPGYHARPADMLRPGPKEVDLVLVKQTARDLEGRAVLKGRVLSPAGELVPGALIRPFGLKTKGGGEAGRKGEDLGTLSDGEGRFVVLLPAGCEKAGVMVEAAGMAREKFRNLEAGRAEKDLRLKEGVRVCGRLLRQGRPVPGGRVGVCQAERNPDTFMGEYVAETDAQGEFMFHHLPAEQNWIFYGKRDSLGPIGVTAVLPFRTAGDGAAMNLPDLQVERGQEVEVVLGLADGKSIPARTMMMVQRAEISDAQCLAVDAEGRIRFLALAGEKLKAEAAVPGYGPKAKQETVPCWEVGRDKNIFTLLYVPVEAKKIAGLVLDGEGKAVPGAQVGLLPADRSLILVQGSLQKGDEKGIYSDAEGKFYVAAGAEWRGVVVLHESGYALAEWENFEGILRLIPWGKIEGKAWIGEQPAGQRNLRLRGPAPVSIYDPLKFFAETMADEQGNFQFTRVPPGGNFLGVTFRSPAYPDEQWVQACLLQIKAGELRKVQVGGKGVLVRGRLQNEGNPEEFLKGKVVEAKLNRVRPPGKNPDPDSFRSYGVEIASDGSFIIRDVLPGSYRFSIEVSERREAKWPVGKFLTGASELVTVGETEVEMAPVRLRE